MTENTENTEQKPRIFIYNGQSFKDPGADFTIEDIQRQLATSFPEVASAKVVTRETDDATEIEFVKQVGTKGHEPGEQAARECCGRHITKIQPASAVLYLRPDACSTYTPTCPHCGSVVDAATRVDDKTPKITIRCPHCDKPIEISVVHIAIYMIRTAP